MSKGFRMAGAALAPALALALTGCATRGPMNLSCPIFDATVTPLPLSQLETDIQSDAGGAVRFAARPAGNNLSGMTEAPAPAVPDALRDAFRRAAPPSGGAESLRGAEAPAAVTALLLSGGGQWGAFGAGFLGSLQASGDAIDPDIVTGVSTGGLQSLFVTVGTPDAYTRLLAAYSPRRQADLVTTNSTFLTAVTGSMAGIKPLRRAIEAALCTEGKPEKGCPMITQLADSRREALIGFVEASSGQFMVADVKKMANTNGAIYANIADKNRVARDCLTGAALASAGMPLFFQPVRIEGRVYYDGGVRQSVFLAKVAEAAAASMKNASGDTVKPAPRLYVIRNGPTQLLGPNGTPGDDVEVDGKFDALTAALRAQSIIVNQVEIGSIAALRLFHPYGEIKLATADGYQNHEWTDASGMRRRCDKGKERFFNPDFMACLRSLGRTKAARSAPWIPLTALPPPGDKPN